MNNIIEESFLTLEEKLIDKKNFNSKKYYRNKKTVSFIMVNFEGFNLSKKYKIKNLNDNKTKFKINGELASDGSIASYFGHSNRIYFNSAFINKEVIIHELIHMATYESESKSGFVIGIDDCYIEHLNEGITQYLACKVIDKDESRNIIYSSQTRFAKLLEFIVGEDELLYYFSNLKFQEFNSKYKLPNDNFAIARLVFLMEEFHNLIDETLCYELTKKELKKINYQATQILNKAQKILIELYTTHRLKHASKEEIQAFLNNLITVDVDNLMIKEILEPVLRDKENIHKKMNIKMKKYLRK